MKKLIYISLIFLGGWGCRQKQATSRQEIVTPVDSVDFTVFREEINSIIRESPGELEIINFINEQGSSYIFDLTLPVEAMERFETQYEISLSWGAYMTDMIYANVYNRHDVIPYLSDVIKKMTLRLGVKDQIPLTVNMLDMISQNKVGRDSVEYYAERLLKTCRNELSTSEVPDVYALVFIGANMESFYLLTQLTSYAKENQAMISYLSERRDLAKNLLELMEFFPSDESLQPYVEKMSLISQYFDAHPEFTEKELSELTALIQEMRNGMFSVNGGA